MNSQSQLTTLNPQSHHLGSNSQSQLSILTHSDNLTPLAALRRARPAPGSGWAVEVVVANPAYVVEDTLRALAQVAFRLWPNWHVPYGAESYGEQPIGVEAAKGASYGEEPIGVEAAKGAPHAKAPGALETRAAQPVPTLNRFWLAWAFKAAKLGRVPFSTNLAFEIQAEQLALAISGAVDSIHLAAGPLSARSEGNLPQDEAGESRWARFGKRLESLSDITRLPLVFLLPESLLATIPLDDFPGQIERLEDWMTSRAYEGQGDERGLGGAVGQLEDEAKGGSPKTEPSGAVFAKVGEPHPLSAVESILAEALESDPGLKGLFLCNQLLSALNDQYQVDFFWPDGALVVEVDGYKFHSGKEAFARDRHRDWALFVTGRRVMRLTAMEVKEDVKAALDKIRQAVAFVSQGLKPSSEG